MKKTRILALILMFAMLIQIMPTITLGVSAASGNDTIVLYPEYPEKIERDYMYRIFVSQGGDEYEIPVYNSMRHTDYMSRGEVGAFSEKDRRFCQFSATPSEDNPVTVKVVVNTDMKSYSVIPSSKNIESAYSGNVVTFEITESGQYVFRLNDNDVTNVAIFADEVETHANVSALETAKKAEGYTVVRYNASNSAPNEVSRTGKIFYIIEGWQDVEKFELKSNQGLYIAPGAVLNARVQVMNSQSNITISGRGMLRDFNDSRAYNASDELISTRYYNNLLTIGASWSSGVTNVEIKDIVLFDAKGFNLVIQGATNCTVDNMKVVSNEISTDGISLFGSSDITVTNSYIYNADNIFVLANIKRINMDNLLVGTSIATFFPQGGVDDVNNFTNINIFRTRAIFQPYASYNPTWAYEEGCKMVIENLCAIDCVAPVNGGTYYTAPTGRLVDTYSGIATTQNTKYITFKNASLPDHANSYTIRIGAQDADAAKYRITLKNVYAGQTAVTQALVDGKLSDANADSEDLKSTVTVSNDGTYEPIERNTTTATYTAYKTYVGATNWSGRQYYSPTLPYAKNSTTYISAKTTAELFGFNTYFDEDDKSLTIYDEDVLVRATVGSNVVLHNDETVTLSAAVEYGEEVMVPIDFFSKTLGISATVSGKVILIGNYDRAENLVKNGDFEDKNALESWTTLNFARLTRSTEANSGSYGLRFADNNIFKSTKSYQGVYYEARDLIRQSGPGVYEISFWAKCNETDSTIVSNLSDTTKYNIFATVAPDAWIDGTTLFGATAQALTTSWKQYKQTIVVADSGTSAYTTSKALYALIMINGAIDVSVDDITFTKVSDVQSTSQTNTLKLSDNTTTVNYGSSKTLTISGTSASSCTLSTTSDYLTIVQSGASATVSVKYPSNYARTARIIAKNSSGTVTGNLVVTIPATTTDKHVVDFDTNLVVEDSYTVGDTLDTSSLKLTNVLYNDSTTATVDGSNATVDADFSTAGEKTITVTYDNKSVSYTVTVKEPESTNEAKLKTLGASIRLKDDNHTAGLRFAATIAKNELYDKYYPTTDESKNYKYSDANNYQFGTIIIPEKLIPEDQNVISVFMNEETKANVLEIVGKGIWEQDAESLTFTGVLVDIPETKNNYTTKLQAAFYVRVRDSATDEWVYYFSDADDIVTHSYYSVAVAAAETNYNYSKIPNPTEEEKAMIDALNEIIEFVEKDNWITDKWW